MEATAYLDMAEVQDSHWWYVARRKILATLISRLRLPRHAKILEAGCGPGGNLTMLDKFGAVCALEPYAPAADIARSRGNWQIKSGSLPSGIAYEGPFDLIAAFDVIEHVEQDIEALVALRTRLGHNGCLLMTVPACPWLWSAHDEHNHHFRRYTRAHLVHCLRSAGYEIDRVSYFNSLLFPLIAGVRLLQKALNVKTRAEEVTPGPVVNHLLAMIFSAEKYLLSVMNMPIGVSLFAIARPAR
jgi:SAM-dependent methyltransferase